MNGNFGNFEIYRVQVTICKVEKEFVLQQYNWQYHNKHSVYNKKKLAIQTQH